MISSLGDRIRSQRERLGFSNQALAERAGLLPQRLEEVEASGSMTNSEFAALAAALAVDPGALYRGDFDQDPRRSVARFRGASESIAPEDARLLRLAAEVGRIGYYIQGLLDRSRSPIERVREIRGVSSRPEPWRQGYELGEAARWRLHPEGGPIPSLQGFLESLDIHIARVRFITPDIEAASLFEPGNAIPVVLLNRDLDRVRMPLSRRAILAHELCHLLHDGGERDLTSVSRENSSPQEQRANGFAPSFLAPESEVALHEHAPLSLVHELAEVFGLSFEGAAWHAKNLRLLTQTQCEWLLKQASRVRGQERFDVIQHTPPGLVGLTQEPTALVEGRLSELVVLAYQEGAISTGRANEILALS